jgi:glycosyltransferase involved in cell wall biosynthesis
LLRERQATLLVNPRSTKEEFTKYSFPSKTIEYMLSGTPVLTTRLQGIPEEYFKYVFSAEDNDVSLLTDAINNALSHTDAELAQMGLGAREYIVKNKNSVAQAKRILEFIKEV